jgi:3D (Asp-Asp-Asp) domain-containing protein
MSTKLHTKDVQTWLRRLGYYDGEPSSDYLDPDYRSALKRFQRDFRKTPDGWYGVKTESALLPLIDLFNKGCGHVCMSELRRWRKTSYWIGEASPGGTPMFTPKGTRIASVTARSFVEAALEGTTRLPGGKLANVATNPRYRKCNPKAMALVFKLAKRYGWIPTKPGYAGITINKAATKAVGARTFSSITPGPNGWPVWNKIEADPFRSVAADIGRVRRSDPKWKKKGGVIPLGTHVFILELVGLELPDGTIHDGWCVVNDCGGGIFGAHIDLFTGSKKWRSQVKVPGLVHIWFKGIEKKIPMDYAYGL